MGIENSQTVRFAAVGDLHCRKESAGTLREFFAQASHAADALLLCGDLTDYGLAEEAKVLADELSVVKVPIVAVLGNHDYESDQADQVTGGDCIFESSGVRIAVEKASLTEILGSLEIDYRQGNLVDSGFVFRQLYNGAQCGCGESFTPVKNLPGH